MRGRATSPLPGCLLGAALVAAALLPATAAAQTRPPSSDILLTPHNLSMTGGGGQHNVRSSQEQRVCIYCHTPHHSTGVVPLWSRDLPDVTIYIPYRSPTMRATPRQPQGASRLCLSCHDGTIALGTLAGGYVLDPSLPTMPSDMDPKRNANLGRDLTDDHPISFAYPFGVNPELTNPSSWPPGVSLEEGTYVECTSCHDPHDNRYGNFLLVDSRTQHDALCTVCHAMNGWQAPDAGHRTGGTVGAPLAPEIAADGCRNCHVPHNSAPGVPHLLKAVAEEDNCVSTCHRQLPYTNVGGDFDAQYTHPVARYQGMHSANPTTYVEDVPVPIDRKHVECVDCHNPHRSGTAGTPLGSATPAVPPASVAPNVNGALRGVRGVDRTGRIAVDEASYEYEICFKCHAGPWAGAFAGFGIPPRIFSEADESKRFSSLNPSYHPVADTRQGTGRSLVAAYSLTMRQIYCIDCHNPHGSNERFMLRASNSDLYPSAAWSYPLCFRCHEQTYLLNPGPSSSTSAELHRKHVVEKLVPCSTCHDPHGVPATMGAGLSSGVHLMNFDTRYAGNTSVYDPIARTCTVACHGTKSY